MGLPNNMDIDQYAGWMCLMEAIDFIDKGAKKYKKRPKLKPLVIRQYIKERKPSMIIEVTHNEILQ